MEDRRRDREVRDSEDGAWTSEDAAVVTILESAMMVNQEMYSRKSTKITEPEEDQD